MSSYSEVSEMNEKKKDRCGNCGGEGHKRPTCPASGGTVVRSYAEAAQTVQHFEVPQNILHHRYQRTVAYPTHIGALDRIFVSRLGDSIGVPSGGKIFLTGQPGTGKTTLIAQILDGLSESGCECVLASNEMDKNSISGMVRALNLKHGFRVIDEQELTGQTSALLPVIAAMVNSQDFGRKQVVLAVDSLQGFNLDQKNPTAKAWADFEAFAKETGVIIFIINHLRKDGDMAGAAILRQRCEAVLNLQRDEDNTLSLNVEKNRFGMVCNITGLVMEKTGLNFANAMILQDV